jgi:hypothetical protein
MTTITVKDFSGNILTGKLWRKRHRFFNDLPFYSNIPRMDEMAGALLEAFGHQGLDNFCMDLLVVRQRKCAFLI